MPWTLAFTVPNLLDDGKYYVSLPGGVPPLTGSVFFGIPFVSLAATATAGTITFAALPATPLSGLQLLLTDPTSPTAGGGDFFRWNGSLPASGAVLSCVTVKTDDLTFSDSDLQAQVEKSPFPPFPLSTGWGASVVVNVTSLNLKIHATSVGFLGLASLQVITHGKPIASVSFSLSGDWTIQPSRDVADTSRILALKATDANLVVFGFEPGFIPNLSADGLANHVTPIAEGLLNSQITSAVQDRLKATNQTLSPGTVISAQRVLLAEGSMVLGLVLANIQGPVFSTLRTAIRAVVTISPDPVTRRGKSTQYTVTVTDPTGTPVNNAEVTLLNYDASRRTVPQSGPTKDAGQWKTSPDTVLMDKVVPHLGTDTPPTVTVTQGDSAFTFSPVTLELLLDP